MIEIPESYEQLLSSHEPSDVGIKVFTLDQMEKGQIGYGCDPDGRPLEGGWKAEWLAIGYEELCGDPLFIDTAQPQLPVYTAAHGQGSWAPDLIAPSTTVFFEFLNLIKKVKQNLLSPEAALSKITEISDGADLEFWVVLLEE